MLLPLSEEEHAKEVARFNDAGGDDLLYENLPLDVDSHVLDIGGYRGTWSSTINERYDCHLHICEPDLIHARHLVSILPLARVYPVAVADVPLRYACLYHYLDGQRASIYSSSVTTSTPILQQPVPTLGIADLIQALPELALIHLNAEGSEFDILRRLLSTDDDGQPRHRLPFALQIQFHLGCGPAGRDLFPFVDQSRYSEDLTRSRNLIRNRLYLTHDCVFEFPWVWEYWTPRS